MNCEPSGNGVTNLVLKRCAACLLLPFSVLLVSCGLISDVLGMDPEPEETVTIHVPAGEVVMGGRLPMSAEAPGQAPVIWEASHGHFEGAGDHVTYVAPPNEFGPVTVTVRNADDLSMAATASITVVDDLSVELAFYNTGRIARLRVSSTISHTFQNHTQVLYEYFDDAFDFIFTYRYDVSGICGYVHVSQQATGIGRELLDVTADYGSNGRLRGVPFIGIPPVVSPFPYRLVVQSLTKAWGNWVVEAAIPGRAWPTQPFWGFTSAAGVMGGFDRSTLQEVEPGLYEARSQPGRNAFTTTWGQYKPYSNIELYLMGLLPAEEVEPLLVAVNPEWVDNTDSGLVNGLFRAEGFQELTVEELIAIHGERELLPTPTELRALNVLLTDVLVPQEYWAELDRGIELLGHRSDSGTERPTHEEHYLRPEYLFSFEEMTGGRAFIQMDDLLATLKTGP